MNEATRKAMFSSATDEWATPDDFYKKLDAEFDFMLDVCATAANAKVGAFYTPEENGLLMSWSAFLEAFGGSAWMNPPYSQIAKWMEKAYVESQKGATVVCLVPSRTDTRWWHSWVEGKAEVRFVKGRLKFGGSKNSAPFPSAVVIFRPPTAGGVS